MDFPITLHTDDESKTVQLSGLYDISWGGTIKEMKAMFRSDGSIDLYRFSGEAGEGSVKHFSLSGQEMTALLSAWETFKAEKDLQRFLEERRKAAVIEEAKQLVESLPIEITEEEGSPEHPHWSIKSDLSAIDYTAFGEDSLLERVKQAIRDHERFMTEQAIHDEIKEIQKACPAVAVTQTRQGFQYPWRVTLEGTPCVFVGNANTPEELLRAVQAAKEKYERWLAEQDVHAEVEKVTAACPAVNVAQEGNTWLVTIKGMCYSNYVNTPQELLECVKRAKEMHERDQEKRLK